MFPLDSVVPKFPLTCVTRNNRDIAICSPNGIYILEDYKLPSMKRRHFTLPNEFRAISYISPNRTDLIALTSEGKSIWFIDPLQKSSKMILESDPDDKFTCIRVKHLFVIIGTAKGNIITKSIENGDEILKKENASENPISFLIDENCFVDSKGRLHYNQQMLIEDEILQPCALLKSSDKHFYFIKHRNVYILNPSDLSVKIAKLDSSYICAAEFKDQVGLYICTEAGEIFHLQADRLQFIPLQTSNAISDCESDSDSEVDSGDEESVLKSERILALIQNPNCRSELLLLKSDPVNKRAWFDTIPISIEREQNDKIDAISEFESVNVSCPLCDDDRQQLIKMNSFTCQNGHPITICCQTRKPIESCFRCRNCHIAYSFKPAFCNFCSNLITK